jgi:hypothetical protein
VSTKVKTPGTGEIMVEEAVQTSTWRGCANSYMERLCKLLHGEAVQTPLFPVQGHAWSPTESISDRIDKAKEKSEKLKTGYLKTWSEEKKRKKMK